MIELWLLSAITAAIIARSRGRSGPAWFGIGLLIGVFALVLVLALPPIVTAPKVEWWHNYDPTGEK